MIQEREVSRGLTTKEAEKRIKNYGLNELKHKKKKSPILIFLAQFNDFIVWVLIGATLISGIMGDKADAITILIIVVVNAILGFVQEYKYTCIILSSCYNSWYFFPIRKLYCVL